MSVLRLSNSRASGLLLGLASALLLFQFASCSGTHEQDSAPTKLAVTNAIKELRKIEAATQVGATLDRYSGMLIECQAAVNEAASKLSEDELKRELRATMDAYVDAREGWDKSIEASGIYAGQREIPLYDLKRFPLKPGVGQKLKEKYKIQSFAEEISEQLGPQFVKDRPKEFDFILLNKTLRAIWKEASEHLGRASVLRERME